MSPSVSVASRRITLSQRPLRDLCSFVFGATRLKQQPLHCLASLLEMNYSLAIKNNNNNKYSYENFFNARFGISILVYLY